jgi:hypothetical protein
VDPDYGIGPITESLQAFAEFFNIDPDLVQAGFESSAVASLDAPSPADIEKTIREMTETEKTDALLHVFSGDRHVGHELRARVRAVAMIANRTPPAAARNVGEIRGRAATIALERLREADEKAAAEKKRKEIEAQKARQARLDGLARRGDSVWRDVEVDIELRNASGYDRAAALLQDLQALAEQRGQTPDFTRRLNAIRARHDRKREFIKRLTGLR